MRLATSSHLHSPIFAAILLMISIALVPPASAGEDCSWLDDFEVAYEQGDATAYGGLLAPEFRFHFGDAENRNRRPQGWSKDEELASYTNLHRGVIREDGTSLPRALEIDVECAGVRTGSDPDMPGSADHLLVFVQAATLNILFADGRRVVDTAPHAFRLVRGKAMGRSGDEADAWFARSWIERPTEAPQLLAALHGDPDFPATGAVQAALPRRGLLWPNPVRAGGVVSLAFDLATEARVALEVFDVRGRAVSAVAARTEPAGRRLLSWDGRDDAGRAAPAGIYFLRARLGDRDARHRVVVID